MQLYNHTRQLFLSGTVNISSLQVMLVNGYTFSATETDMTTATSSEVSGNGWAVGGPTIANAAATIVNTNEARLDGDDISVTASGGAIGPADGMVVYDSVNSDPLFYYQFSASKTADDGTPFNITWAATGVYEVNAPA